MPSTPGFVPTVSVLRRFDHNQTSYKPHLSLHTSNKDTSMVQTLILLHPLSVLSFLQYLLAPLQYSHLALSFGAGIKEVYLYINLHTIYN